MTLPSPGPGRPHHPSYTRPTLTGAVRLFWLPIIIFLWWGIEQLWHVL